MASDAISREVMRDQLVTLLDAKLVSGATQYAQVVSNGRYDNQQAQTPVVMVYSSGSRRDPGGMGTANYNTYARLLVHVYVKDAQAGQSIDQQGVEDTLDTLEKLIADVVADNRSVSGVWTYLRHAPGGYSRIVSAKVGGSNYQIEMITLEAEYVC